LQCGGAIPQEPGRRTADVPIMAVDREQGGIASRRIQKWLTS
jgi:hypothetical protein